jgi:hypothetical protein
MQKEQYLGDGVYASFVGWQFCLLAPRENGDHVVYLDPVVLRTFDECHRKAQDRD